MRTRGVARRALDRLWPTPQWPAGFVDLPRDALDARAPGAPEVWWALCLALALGIGGYFVAALGIGRLNSVGLAPWLPTFWLILAVTLGRASQIDGGFASSRVAVVRGATLMLGAIAAGCATVAMLTNRLFALGHHGDNPSMPIGAIFGCAALPFAPFVSLVALGLLRRGNRLTSRALAALAPLSLAALAALVIGASLRHLRAPSLVHWLDHPPASMRVPLFTQEPERWQQLPPNASGQVWHRRVVRGLVLTAFRSEPTGECTTRIGLDTISTSPDDVDFYFSTACGDVVFGLDREAQLLIPRRGYRTFAYDYGRHRIVRGDVRDIRRPLATVPEWTIGGALALALSLAILRRASRIPATLDRSAWRVGTRRGGSHEITFDDGTPPLNASMLPTDDTGPVLVSTWGERLGPGYRDDGSRAACTILRGTFDEIDRALRDARDVARMRVLAITWTAAAPLVASWWVGLV